MDWLTDCMVQHFSVSERLARITVYVFLIAMVVLTGSIAKCSYDRGTEDGAALERVTPAPAR